MQLIPIPIRINGHSYEWADIQFSIAGGVPVKGITEINYGYTRNVQNVMGAGSEPVSVGYGAKAYTCSITMKLEEVRPLVDIAPVGDLTQIPSFAIVIAWLDSENAIITDTLTFCNFTNNEVKTKQGDTSTDVTLNINFAGVIPG